MTDAKRTTDRDSIQVIARAAAVLRIVAEAPTGLSLTEISRSSGLARSTVQRIVKSLEDENFLTLPGNRTGYALGDGLLRLARPSVLNVAEVVQPLLLELAQIVDETVDLSVLKGDSALFVGHIAGKHRLSALSTVGTEFPLHSTANGKALLSCLAPAKLGRFLDRPLSRETENTIIAPAILQTQIEATLTTGVAFDVEEHTVGVCAVGTAFLDDRGCPYAISIPVPKQRFETKRDSLVEPLVQYREKMSLMVNGTLPESRHV